MNKINKLIWLSALIISPAALAENITIEYEDTSTYYGGFRGKLTFTNNSNTDIDGWALSCVTNFTITDASGAIVTSGTPTTLTNESWTNMIQAGGTRAIEFGGEPEVNQDSFNDCTFNQEPVTIAINGTDNAEDQHDASQLSASFKMTSSYEGAFRGKVVIKNDDEVKTSYWQLACDTDFTISDASGAEYTQENGRFEFNNTEWGAEIQPGSSATINFGATPALTEQAFENCTLNSIATDIHILSGAAEGIETQTITFPELDATEQIIYQHTIPLGQSELLIAGVSDPIVKTNNDEVITVSANGNKVLLNGLRSGRASLKISDGQSKERYIGIRVRNADGSLPGMPNYLAVGSVSEDSIADLDFWKSFDEEGKNKRVDIRYIYLNGGPFPLVQAGWATTENRLNTKGGRAISFIRESLKYGMIPSFVYYNIPDGNESYTRNMSHLISQEYMQAYFTDLKYAIDIINKEAGDETVQMILEPDALGYMAQNDDDPVTTFVYTQAAYELGFLGEGDPVFDNTLTDFVSAVNYIIERDAPNVEFGWQMNLWAIKPGGYTTPVGVRGLMHITDEGPAHQGYLGWEQGRINIYEEAKAITDYYLRSGVSSYGADFISIDKYGLDATGYGGDSAINIAEEPEKSTWFWNADHWNNYLLFVKAMKDISDLPVVLWQIPVGHINSSTAISPYSADGSFPNLTNTPMKYEDSAATYFLGDQFTPGSAARMAHFSQNKSLDAKVYTQGNDIIWADHMQEAADAGAHTVLFGAGVGVSTDGVGLSETHPTDGFYWIHKVQRYYENTPIALTVEQ
ncbi:cellulose binding domain-containing protein [Thaumasiovibrio sp. DFM-14]|uniref:cellulose binding domain-containing protein n=1 Tax=Thaumasiovibrio sp. DFM-14 TaxID=3384792 RepID=UPI0039A26095